MIEPPSASRKQLSPFDHFALFPLAVVLGSAWLVPFTFIGGLWLGMRVESEIYAARAPFSEDDAKRVVAVREIADASGARLEAFRLRGLVAVASDHQRYHLPEIGEVIDHREVDVRKDALPGRTRFNVVSSAGDSQVVSTYRDVDTARLYSTYKVTGNRIEPLHFRAEGIGMMVGAILGAGLGVFVPNFVSRRLRERLFQHASGRAPALR